MDANMMNRMSRVNHVLESIGHDIRTAAGLGLIEAGEFSAVPAGLRNAIAKTAILVIEADDEEERRAKKERDNAKARLKKRVKRFRDKHGREPNEDEIKDLEKLEKFAPQKAAGRAAKVARAGREEGRKFKKAADALKAMRARRHKRPEELEADIAREKAGEAPERLLPPEAGRVDDPEMRYRSHAGKSLHGDALKQVIDKRRREGLLGGRGKFGEKDPETVKGKPAEGGIAALRKAGEGMRAALRKSVEKGTRGELHKRGGVTTGVHYPMRMPRGSLPSEFRAQQAAKSADLDWLERERQRRSGVAGVAGKLARLRGKGWGKGTGLERGTRHDDPKGYEQDPSKLREPKHKRRPWAGHHVDDSGRQVHSTGKKANKQFANRTTFRDSDTDALLHTDKSKKGARGDADTSEFVFHGDVDADPREKWYRVSKEGGYAAAMASLGKSYHKDPKMRSKVINKVKSTGFVDDKGEVIHVKPTGALHDERGACVRDRHGNLGRVGKELQRQNPKEWSRLCKGAHGPSGTPSRNEYQRGFDPRHDDAQKIHKLHKAAEAGKADVPERNIALHKAARPVRRRSVQSYVGGIGRAATRTRWHLRNRP